MKNKYLRRFSLGLLIFIGLPFLYIKYIDSRIKGEWVNQHKMKMTFNPDKTLAFKSKDQRDIAHYEMQYIDIKDKYIATPKNFRILVYAPGYKSHAYVKITDKNQAEIQWSPLVGSCGSVESSYLKRI